MQYTPQTLNLYILCAMHFSQDQEQERNPKKLSILQFKPRQVLLLERKNINTMKTKSKIDSESGQKTKLFRAVGHFLWKSKLFKTLSKFQSELMLDRVDNWEQCSSYTEEGLLKCLETINKENGHFEVDNDQDSISKKDGASGCISSLETVNKKKKKKSKTDELDSNAAENESEAKIEVSDLVPEPTVKSKKKKKKVVDESDEPIAVTSEVLTFENGTVNEPPLDKSSKKSKDKKKKKSKSVSESLVENADDEATNTQIKESKKRKRVASDVKETEPANEISNEECKRRKTVGMEESKVENQLTKVNGALGSDGLAGKESKEEDAKVSFNDSQEQSAKQKSMKKQNGGSAEPKSVNAFQRVKIDKVVFTDDRLQDNSYWAKDGAEVGYGAKAQEVLGQVRGRDFRHEKTKKKRGSYRGGTIDFTSHSVKFNYSDED